MRLIFTPGFRLRRWEAAVCRLPSTLFADVASPPCLLATPVAAASAPVAQRQPCRHAARDAFSSSPSFSHAVAAIFTPIEMPPAFLHATLSPPPVTCPQAFSSAAINRVYFHIIIDFWGKYCRRRLLDELSHIGWRQRQRHARIADIFRRHAVTPCLLFCHQ